MQRPPSTTPPSPPPKRWTLTLARGGVYLLIGAVVTWAVAWACALIGTGNYPLLTQLRDNEQRWPVPVPQSWPAPTEGGTSRLMASTVRVWEAFDPELNFHGLVHNQRFGIPFRSMQWHLIAPEVQTFRNTALRLTDRDVPGRGYDYVPTEVLPLGFTLNTLLAAGLLLAAAESIAFARRRRRRTRCPCPSCSYDRTGLAPVTACPECGTLPSGRPARSR